jgi:hypothetical protein
MDNNSDQDPQDQRPPTDLSWWKMVLLIPLGIVLLVLSPLLLAGLLLWHFGLLFALWTFWRTRGRSILFVYSDSPSWREHIEQSFLPRLEGKAIILNWSERAKWKNSLTVFAFNHWGDKREFNPLGVVFRPFRRPRVFRFHQPFLDFKHGKPGVLARMEAEFFGLVEGAGRCNS